MGQHLHLLVIVVLVLFIVALLRENYLSGCSRFLVHFHQADYKHHAQAEDPPSLAPSASASVVTTATTAKTTVATQKKPKEAVKRLAFARFPKTGSRYAIQKLRAVLGKDVLIIPEAIPLHLYSAVTSDAFVIGSVRNPCEGYLSLWAFQSDHRVHAGLMKDLQERKPQDYVQLVGQDMASNFTTPEDIQRFHRFIRYFAHENVDLGLLSGRFYGKYLSTSPKMNIRDNAMLVKELPKRTAAEMQEALKAMHPEDLVDCWLHTETMDQDLRRCLGLYQSRGGTVDLTLLKVDDVKGASHHGACDKFFDENTERMVMTLDEPLFTKFGYKTCCILKEPRQPRTSSALSNAGPLNPWAWGDPFEDAEGRPETKHSGSVLWRAKVGPCDRSVEGPNERELGTVQMLTLPPIRMALDKAILACLQEQDKRNLEHQWSAKSMMYQCVLSGLLQSCAFLAKTISFSPTEPLQRSDIMQALSQDKHYKRSSELRSSKLSVFELTGFRYKLWTHTIGRNLAQLAIWMGHADLIQSVVGLEPTTVIDSLQRTLQDYLSAPGSPVYNWPMADAVANVASSHVSRHVQRLPPRGLLNCEGQEYPELSLGWTEETNFDHYYACDFEVVDTLTQQDFEEKFRDMGRPVLVRNFAAKEDRCNLRKNLVMKTHGNKKFDLGPIAYPRLVGAQSCEKNFSIEEAEMGARCQRHGNASNYHASHAPGLASIDITDMPTFKKLKDGLLPRINRLSKQYFWGGDRSGAALHYHVSAFNVLFVGEKEWYVTPPYLAARSGMTTERLFSRSGINHQHIFRCTQYAGDLVLVPDGWGHATLNHGFGLGIGVLYDEAD